MVFINARDFGDEREPLSGSPPWNDEHYKGLAKVVKWLAKVPQITVVVGSWEGFRTKLRYAIDKDGDLTVPLEMGSGLKMRTTAEIVEAVVDKAKEDARLARFVLGLTLFRHPCYLSALHAWGLLPSRPTGADNDDERFGKANEFLTILRACDAIRDTSGQSVFMYGALRKDLRTAIVKAGLVGGAPATMLAYAEGHQGIADWYIKLYRSSGDVEAAFEAIFHRLQCIEVAQDVVDEKERRALDLNLRQ